MREPLGALMRNASSVFAALFAATDRRFLVVPGGTSVSSKLRWRAPMEGKNICL